MNDTFFLQMQNASLTLTLEALQFVVARFARMNIEVTPTRFSSPSSSEENIVTQNARRRNDKEETQNFFLFFQIRVIGVAKSHIS